LVRGLCQQHGSLQYFYIHAAARQAVVTYSSCDEAAAAQRSLDSHVVGGATLSVDFIPDSVSDVSQLSSSAPTDLNAAAAAALSPLSSIWAAAAGPHGASSSSASEHHSVWPSGGAGGVWGAASTSGL